jgi:CO/xanthine dehydrogenase FAD-binding subunit
VGSVQIQNRATIAGNLCNASPAADGVPPLLTLEAELEIRAMGGARRLPLVVFIQGNRRTALKAGELVTGIRLSRRLAAGNSCFLKLGSRRYLVISIVSVAALLLTESGRIGAARIAVGACSAAPQRLPLLEQALQDRAVSDIASAIEPTHLAPLSPIDDVRAAAGYRRDAALQLVRQALIECAAGRAGGMA